MADENHPKKSINESEKEKENEKVKTLIGLPLVSTTLVHGGVQSPWEITSSKANNLIPRVIVTNIVVYAISTDIWMDSSRRHRTNNIQHRTNNNINEDLTRVRTAIRDHNQEMLQTILNHQPDLIKGTDQEGLTPLSFAASNGFCEMVRLILKKFPSSIKNPNKDSSYPIHKACLGGHVDVLKLFYSKYSKSVLAVDRQGKTVLHLAAEKRGNKLKDVVSYLLGLQERRELMNKKDENWKTALELAVNNGNREVEALIVRSMQQQ